MTDAQELFMAWLAIGNTTIPAYTHQRTVDACVAAEWVDMDDEGGLSPSPKAKDVSEGAQDVAVAYSAYYAERSARDVLKRLGPLSPMDLEILQSHIGALIAGRVTA